MATETAEKGKRGKASDKPYASPDSKFWQAAGLKVESKEIEFDVEGTTLKTSPRQIDFGGNLQVATAAFGNLDALLKEAQESVNSWLVTQSKNAAKQGEKQFIETFKAASARWSEKNAGAEMSDEQKLKLKANVRRILDEQASIAERASADI